MISEVLRNVKTMKGWHRVSSIFIYLLGRQDIAWTADTADV